MVRISLFVSLVIGLLPLYGTSHDDTKREEAMQKTIQQVHSDTKQNGQGISAHIFTGFFATCQQQNRNPEEEKEIRVSDDTSENTKNHYSFFKTKDGIDIHSVLSAKDMRPVQSRSDSPAERLDNVMLGLGLDPHIRFPEHATIGTVRDRFTVCEYFRHYDTNLRYKTKYNCVTKVPMDKDNKAWVKSVADEAKKTN